MSAPLHHPSHPAEDAIRAYVRSWQACVDADGHALLEALIQRDEAFHHLVGVIGMACPMCEWGSCPYQADVEMYSEELATDELRRSIEDVDDPNGLFNDPEPS
jgi:hypothetical protein